MVAVPVTAGATVLTGANNAATATVDADHTVFDPSTFDAVTAATMNLPDWAEVNRKVGPVAPVMAVQVEGWVCDTTDDAVQENHEFVYEVGTPDHVPCEAVSVCSTRAVPVIAGATVDAGIAAWAGSTLMTANRGAERAAAATIATMRFSLARMFMGFDLSTITKH